MTEYTSEIRKAHNEAIGRVSRQLGGSSDGIAGLLMAMATAREGKAHGIDMNPMMKAFESGPVAKANAISRQLRSHSPRKARMDKFPSWTGGVESGSVEAIRKAGALDVGGLTDLSQVTGGQAFGMVSMDTRMARGTIRPRSFTLFNYLNKTQATQIVDYWAYASSTGGAPVGAAYQSFSSQTAGAININAGSYQEMFIELKLAVDGRAITMALAQQNSITSVADQESANATLSLLETINWALYWGNPTLYPNQPVGIWQNLFAKNKIDFFAYYNSAPVQALGISPQQALFNLLYEQVSFLSSYRQFGQVTHAFMTPTAIADLQSLVTTGLRNIVTTLTGEQNASRAIVVNGDLTGINTRIGDVAFPMDMLIAARDVPLVAVIPEGTTTSQAASPTVLSAPASVTAAVVTGVAASEFTSTGGFAPSGGGTYVYAVATADGSMNESVLTYSAPVTGVLAGSGVNLTITPGANGTPAAFRVFRSGLGYNASSNQNPAAFRWIGDIASNGVTAVVFQDLNNHIPGSETIFLLDLDEGDDALDYRVMLPLTKIELFAQNLYMPWAIAHIGAPRLRVPKWHGAIYNYPSMNPQFNALQPNASATV